MHSAFVIAFVAVFAYVTASDYCSEKLCAPGSRHIACGNEGQFAPSCPKNAHLVDLAPYKKLILKEHNQYRNLISGGKLRGYPAAARMATMQWDEELASLAALNAKHCSMKQDKCHNTEVFKYSGQNVAVWSHSDTVGINNRQIKEAINGWFEEYEFADSNLIASYGVYLGRSTRDFLLMVNDKNDRVGCAAVGYIKNMWETFVLVCNYAHSCFFDRPVYNTSSTSGVYCKTGTNAQYKNLCSYTEVYAYEP